MSDIYQEFLCPLCIVSCVSFVKYVLKFLYELIVFCCRMRLGNRDSFVKSQYSITYAMNHGVLPIILSYVDTINIYIYIWDLNLTMRDKVGPLTFKLLVLDMDVRALTLSLI